MRPPPVILFVSLPIEQAQALADLCLRLGRGGEARCSDEVETARAFFVLGLIQGQLARLGIKPVLP